jgi:16S rRNA (guanine1207-N2)-methyltransferase
MPEHYYTSKPGSSHRYREFAVKLRGVELLLQTDAGVFSKERLDRGTELLIKAIPLEATFQTMLDLGCGYGPIGLVLARLFPAATVYMSDVNERAVELARKNAATNGITKVEIRAGEGFTPFTGERFDLVATNPPIRAGKQVIYPLIEQAAVFLNPGGWLAAVIMTKQGAKSLEQRMAEVFGNVTEWEKGSGYRVVASQKR